jgi:hypothetical protein
MDYATEASLKLRAAAHELECAAERLEDEPNMDHKKMLRNLNLADHYKHQAGVCLRKLWVMED